MKTPKIAVFTKISMLLHELKTALPNINFIEVTSGSNPTLKDSEIIIADYDLISPVLYDLPNTKWVQGTWAGVDKLLPNVDPTKSIQFPITRFSGKHFGRMMSEYVIAQIVQHERDFYQVSLNQKSSYWSQEGKLSHYRVISDLNIGIMGLGQIGNWLAQVLHLLGATIFGYARQPEPNDDVKSYLKEYYTRPHLPTFLSNCDYIINILPNTVETKGLLNGNALENCKVRHAVFINIGRGSIILDEDLINALNQKWISAAILDVFNTEPLPRTSLLWSMPQVTVTPHISAPSRAKDIAEQFGENYEKYISNKTLPAILDISKGY